ncbi:MAG: ATP-grasp domain-containing protein [Polyangiaceae bacterium]|nr:ATP-grasp domain-containing protein [Polyangiaceae bacterium]
MPLFEKILIANRGEIARRVIRTCKKLGIKTVAIYSEADKDTPHVSDADEAICVGPAAAKDSYLQIDAVLAAVVSTGAKAVHPGYGFLSEKSAFASALAEKGVTFIGPPPAVLDAFGDKMKARGVALRAETSPVPGTDEPITIDTEEGVLQATKIAGDLGYPVIVKAVGGGGGIGMQIVKQESDLGKAFKACSDRGKAAFADARVYLEKYVSEPRHIEVQIFCDTHGNAYALGERECSLQRRHQKIVEESPSPAAFFEGEEGAKRRAALHASALRVVKSVGYVGAGTCEFIADKEGNLYFLEVNARLQVEHPATEMVTGLDLVEWQIRVAAGEKLPDWSAMKPNGHAIEARIYAEDPFKGFIPKPGDIEILTWPDMPSVRVEAGVREGNKVTPYYDPMIAKVIAHGDTRAKAIQNLSEALDATRVHPCVTNTVYLRHVLGSPEFQSGKYDTSFAEIYAKRLVAEGRTS